MFSTQKTIQQSCALSGVGLHTGEDVTLTLKPAKDDEGIRFVRTDLPGQPAIVIDPKSFTLDADVSRCTAIRQGDAFVYTVEHLMGVLCGLGIDNLTIEVHGQELPGLDGSGLEFLKAIKKAGIIDLGKPKRYFDIKEPIGVELKGACIYMVPAPELTISYTLDYNHPYLRSQYVSLAITSDVFEREIAPCRTFCLESETQELRARGFGKGANYDNTLVVGDKGVIKNKLRFADEFARHKILDCIGDLYSLGFPVRGHIYAIRSGHALNRELLKRIKAQKESYEATWTFPKPQDLAVGKEVRIEQIMKILPHRYPFLLVDRVIEIEKGKKAIGIKNVTINDGFFQGHFPSRPVMPGVLMIEAMAQTAGISVLTNEEHHGKVAFFMSVDQAKFRKVVVPGDQLVMEVEVIRDRSRSAQVKGVSKVDGEVVAEADMVFSFADASFLNPA